MNRVMVGLVLLAAGCGGRSGALPHSGGGADGAPAADLISPPPDGSGGPDLLPARVQGLIYQVELRTPQGAQQGAAYVFFTPSPMPFFSPLKAAGKGCNLYPDEEVGDAQFSAGKVTFSGGPYSFSLSPDKPLKKDSWLYPGILFDELFSGKTRLSVSAAGDDLTAFSGKLQGVDDLKATLPVGTFLSRAKAAQLSFPKFDGMIWVTLHGLVAGKSQGNVRCSFPGQAGQATVPAEALSALPGGATRAVLAVGQVREALVKPDARLTVHLVAANLLQKTYYLQ